MKLEAWIALALLGAGGLRGQEVLREGTTEGRILGEEGADPRYRGQWRELEGGLRVERLSFADPTAALRYAEQVMAPHERDFRGQVLVEVRGRHAVVLRHEREDPPLGLSASRLLAQTWTGKAQDEPRTWFGLRDARGLALETARYGPLEPWTLARLHEARRHGPNGTPPGEPGDRLRWLDDTRSAFSLTTREIQDAIDAEVTPLARQITEEQQEWSRLSPEEQQRRLDAARRSLREERQLILRLTEQSALVVQGTERTSPYLESELRELLATSPAAPGSPVRAPEPVAPPTPETPELAPSRPPGHALRGLAGALGGR